MRLTPSTPVLVRSTTSTQVGLHRPVRLESLTPAQMRFLATLEGGRATSAAEQRRHTGLLAAIADAGHGAPPPAPGLTVRIRGAGALGVEAGIALARAQVGVAFVDDARARPGAAPHLPSPSMAAVAADRVRRAVPGADIRGAHGAAQLDVAVAVGLPMVTVHELMAADQPHLLVSCDERGATVSHVIVPGESACGTCVGLARTRADSAWPALNLQCQGRRPHVSALVATLAGALVAANVLLHAGGEPTVPWRADETGTRALPAAPFDDACRCRG